MDKELTHRSRIEDELKRVERRLHEKESLISVISKERKQLDDQVKDLEAELKRLEDELESQKKLLESEIIRRVEAENRAQTLEEEAAFNAQIHQKVFWFQTDPILTLCMITSFLIGKEFSFLKNGIVE